MSFTRRQFLQTSGSLAAISAIPAAAKGFAPAAGKPMPFHLAVINDEISQDFDHACDVAANEFHLNYIELRSMWSKNVSELDDKQLDDTRQILAKYKLRVTDLASPLFKVDWPGAPRSKQSERRDSFHADEDYKRQDAVLARCIEVAKAVGTDRIRCFDFWRLDDPAPFRAAMNKKLMEAAETCQKHGLILLLENEMSCNTATGDEAASTLAAIPNSNFMLNWDPGNAAALGSTPYPEGYDKLPKNRIGHCHCKDVVLKPGGKYEWAPVGGGVVDWAGQFRAFARQDYRHAVSLETHWRGAGTPEASSRASMQGLKTVLRKDGFEVA